MLIGWRLFTGGVARPTARVLLPTTSRSPDVSAPTETWHLACRDGVRRRIATAAGHAVDAAARTTADRVESVAVVCRNCLSRRNFCRVERRCTPPSRCADDHLWAGTTFVSGFMRWLQLRFNGRSTAYHRSLRLHCPNPLAAVTLTD